MIFWKSADYHKFSRKSHHKEQLVKEIIIYPPFETIV